MPKISHTVRKKRKIRESYGRKKSGEKQAKLRRNGVFLEEPIVPEGITAKRSKQLATHAKKQIFKVYFENPKQYRRPDWLRGNAPQIKIERDYWLARIEFENSMRRKRLALVKSQPEISWLATQYYRQQDEENRKNILELFKSLNDEKKQAFAACLDTKWETLIGGEEECG